MKRWYLCSIAALAVSAETGEAEFPTLRARPKTLPGLPPYPYAPTSGQPKPTVTGTSFPRLDLGDGTEMKLELATDAATVTANERTLTRKVSTLFKVKTATRTDRTSVATPTVIARPSEIVTNSAASFQLFDQVLKVDHCSVSGVSVTFYPEGRFAIRFRADQNPLPSDPLTPTLRAATNAATTNLDPVQFKRNKFSITVRGYAADPLGEGKVGATKAVLVELPVEPFWVERGKPLNGFVEGTSESVRRNYKLIDRVDLDFTYR